MLEALAIIDRYDTDGRRTAYTLTGGSVTSKVDGLAEADFYGRYAQAIEERFPGRWIGKVVAQALPRRTCSATRTTASRSTTRTTRSGTSASSRSSARARSATSAARSGTGGSSTRPRCSAPRYVIPNFVAGVEMAKPFGFATVDEAIASTVEGLDFFMSRGDHAALHDLVPGADDAARPRQPGRRAARVPRPPARGLPRRARTSTGSSRRRATATPGAGNAVFSVSSFMDTLDPRGTVPA